MTARRFEALDQRVHRAQEIRCDGDSDFVRGGFGRQRPASANSNQRLEYLRMSGSLALSPLRNGLPKYTAEYTVSWSPVLAEK